MSPVGDATNLIAIDCQRFIEATTYLNWAWASPLLIGLCLVNLWSVLGPASLAGRKARGTEVAGGRTEVRQG